MKKILLFLLLLPGVIEVSGQMDHKLYKTIRPMKENGYNVQEAREFTLAQTPLSNDYCEKLLASVNRFLQKTGLCVKYNNGQPLNRSHIAWILDPSRTWSENREYLNGYGNSHQSLDGKSAVWYDDKSYFRGQVTVLHLDGYELDLYKDICANLVVQSYIYPTSNPVQETYCPPALTAPTAPVESFVPYRKPVVEVTLPAVVLAPKKHNHTLLWVAAGIVVTGVACYFLSQNHHHHIDTGSPGGAPITPPTIPVIPVVPPGGGPGGAPTTK